MIAILLLQKLLGLGSVVLGYLLVVFEDLVGAQVWLLEAIACILQTVLKLVLLDSILDVLQLKEVFFVFLNLVVEQNLHFLFVISMIVLA